jgi:hypothetical protein
VKIPNYIFTIWPGSCILNLARPERPELPGRKKEEEKRWKSHGRHDRKFGIGKRDQS